MKNWFRAGEAALAAVMAFGGLAEEAQAVVCSRKPLKVLMIGNSFSICVLKEMPAIAAELACRSTSARSTSAAARSSAT